jgi:predicted DNA-binding transcriptional regulator AlpA
MIPMALLRTLVIWGHQECPCTVRAQLVLCYNAHGNGWEILAGLNREQRAGRRDVGLGIGRGAVLSKGAWPPCERGRSMSEAKREVVRLYPPDYVSAETLAYRLDCSRSTVDEYVRKGLLPKPETIGNLVRWDFGQVVAFIKARNSAQDARDTPDVDDPYMKGIHSVAAA